MGAGVKNRTGSESMAPCVHCGKVCRPKRRGLCFGCSRVEEIVELYPPGLYRGGPPCPGCGGPLCSDPAKRWGGRCAVCVGRRRPRVSCPTVDEAEALLAAGAVSEGPILPGASRAWRLAVLAVRAEAGLPLRDPADDRE